MPSRILVLIILGFAGFLRFNHIGSYSPYTDEKFTLLNVHGICVGGYNQPELTDKDTFTPKEFWKDRDLNDHYQAIARSDFGTHFTYNVFLKYWIKAFGLKDGMVRTLSVLFNLLTLVLVFWLCKAFLKSTYIGLIAMSILALDPLFISQSHFARSYTLSFLLVVLGTFLFYKILKSENKKETIKLGIYYGIIAAAALLNHYLNFIVFLAHVITAAIYLRSQRKWLVLMAAGAFTLLVMGYWMTAGGGQWSMEFLKDKNALHLKMANLPADQNPMSGNVDPSSAKNVSQKAINIFFDSNLVSFDLYHSLHGILNLALFIFASILFGLTYKFTKIDKQKLLLGFLAAMLILGLVLLSSHYKLAFISAAFVLLVLYHWFKHPVEKELRLILLLTGLLPLFYVIFDAFKTGHTTSLAHRYIGVCVPFLGIIYAVGLYRLFHQKNNLKYLAIIPLAYQLFFVGSEIKSILEDNSARYSFRNEAREENPYRAASLLVIENYSEGDTLFIPSYSENVYSEFRDKQSKNILDAQYLNLYLPKEANYIEKIDVTEPNLLVLKKGNGERKVLFDFQGKKLRY
ncbi:glycosyltransferase family 39 protein [uncultured Arcticibacterium sp.]|uniref:glycosyltransferase family 39 protein n=1 Tax=uncultured Arcticibacterium sp. TaxID=2173042 RepID=UPI0030F89B41